jgi:aspartate aminotransferase-like enzyme
MSVDAVYHRGPLFKEVFGECWENLRWLFQTENAVLTLAGSGTAGLEAACASFIQPQEKAIVIRGGKFGERWFKICQSLGIRAIPLDVPWGQAAQPAQLDALLQLHPDTRAVLWQASETSTGVVHPTQELVQVVRARGDILTLVDGITAVGVYDLPQDALDIDVLVCGSQKALMLPPGLAFVSASERAWRAGERGGCPRYYFSLQREREQQTAKLQQTAFTPAISLIFGLRESLRMLREEGLAPLFARHDQLARAARAGGQAMGLSLFAQKPSHATTALSLPANVDGNALGKRLREGYGVTLGGGQDQLKGKIVRIGHVGYFGPFDIITAISALEMGLCDLGYSVTLGQGVGAAQAVLRS